MAVTQTPITDFIERVSFFFGPSMADALSFWLSNRSHSGELPAHVVEAMIEEFSKREPRFRLWTLGYMGGSIIELC